MLVRLRRATRTARDTFRVTLDLTDPDRPDWETGDCVVRLDVLDAPSTRPCRAGPWPRRWRSTACRATTARRLRTPGSSGTWGRRWTPT